VKRVGATKEKLYFKEKKRGTTLGIKKEMARNLKLTEKQKGKGEKNMRQPVTPTQAS
jgi:hypothetical protein